MCSSSSQRRKSPVLAEEIFDEFLLCRICFAAFDCPKSLSCLHVFCCKCIDGQFSAKSSHRHHQQQQQLYSAATAAAAAVDHHREFTCPLCYRRTPLAPGGANMLPDDLTVSRLQALVGRQRHESEASSCNICMTINHRQSDAVAKCIDCSKLLCVDCETQHRQTKVTSGHSLFSIQVQKEIECKVHSQETIRFYCADCDECVCVFCTFDRRTHSDHSVLPLDEAVCSVRRQLQTALGVSKATADDCDARIESIARCEQAVAMTTQKIKETADRLIREVGEAQVRLREQLHRSVGQEVMKQLETKKSLETFLEGMRSTCDIADVIVAGKDMELLLLKKDVEGKLNSIASVQLLSALPSKSFAQIHFSPGSVNVGHLHDDGMTSLGCSGSTKSRKVFLQHPPAGTRASTRETAAQTDEETDKKTDERGEGRAGVPPTLPVIMTVSVRTSPPPKIKVDRNEEEPRRRRRRDTSQTKAPQSVSSKK